MSLIFLTIASSFPSLAATVRCNDIFRVSTKENINLVSAETKATESEAILSALSDQSYLLDVPAFLGRVALRMSYENVQTQIIDHPNQSWHRGQKLLQIIPDAGSPFGKMASRLQKFNTRIVVAPQLLNGAKASFDPESRIIIVDALAAATAEISEATMHEYRHALDLGSLMNHEKDNLLLGIISSRYEIPHAPRAYDNRFSIDESWAHAVNARIELKELLARNHTVTDAHKELEQTKRVLDFMKSIDFTLQEVKKLVEKKEILNIEDQSETYGDGDKVERVLVSTEYGGIGLYKDDKLNALSITILPKDSDIRFTMTFFDREFSIWKKIKNALENKVQLAQIINPLIDRRYTQLTKLSISVTLATTRSNEIMEDGTVNITEIRELYEHFRLIEQKLGKAVANRLN